jgi:hypothetical protein
MSESLPKGDGGSGSKGGDGGTSKAKKARTGRGGTGVTLSPKWKIEKVKRAPCWQHFTTIKVESKKERGVMETKEKCKFCLRTCET